MKPVRVKKITQETPDTITIIFDVPPYTWQYKAGQYIDIGVTINGERFYRSYSLATTPYQDPRPAITVKRVHNGKVSNYLHDHVKEGTNIDCTAPRGTFTIDYELYKEAHFVFIAGGSGITPIFSMIKALLQQIPQAHIKLVYASRSQKHIIYKKALDQLQDTQKDRLQITHILSQPTKTWKGKRGRLTPDTLLQLLKGPFTTYHYFLCSPPELMTLTTNTLINAGVSTKQIRKEKFTPQAETQLPLLTEKNTSKACIATIHYKGQTYTCNIAKGETLLDAALEEGIEITYSCSSGMCNMCRAKCTKGKVHMLEDEGLTQEEKKEGYILTCVGYPTTQTLTLVLDD